MTWREPEPPWDVQAEVIELPRIFRTQLESVPASVPYLRAPRNDVRPRIARKRIGLVWSSSTYNPARSIPLALLAEICGTADAEFFSFQAGEERCHMSVCNVPLTDLCDEPASVLATASRMLGMDLIITVDTMTAHLAGALGLPVWTLLPFEGDWRWMLDRSDSPWYPTMRLFRQPRRGDWESVVRDLQRALPSG
jgi:ADP-heptose:LPS heptosyltransferase